MLNSIRKWHNKRKLKKILDKLIDYENVNGQQIFEDGTHRHIVVEYFSGGGLWIVIDQNTFEFIHATVIK